MYSGWEELGEDTNNNRNFFSLSIRFEASLFSAQQKLHLMIWFGDFSRENDLYAPETVSKAVSRGNNFDRGGDEDVSLSILIEVSQLFIPQFPITAHFIPFIQY